MQQNGSKEEGEWKEVVTSVWDSLKFCAICGALFFFVVLVCGVIVYSYSTLIG